MNLFLYPETWDNIALFVLSAIWPGEIVMNMFTFSDKMLKDKVIHPYL